MVLKFKKYVIEIYVSISNRKQKYNYMFCNSKTPYNRNENELLSEIKKKTNSIKVDLITSLPIRIM